MNDINTWFLDEDCDWDTVEDDVDNFCGELDEENKNNSDPTEQFILEDEVVENIDDGKEQPLNLFQRYAPRKQLTHNCVVDNMDSFLDEANIEKIIYLNRKIKFEKYVGYLGPKNNKKFKKIFWISEQRRQRKCDTITGRTSCLVPNTKTTGAANIEDTFHLFFVLMLL